MMINFVRKAMITAGMIILITGCSQASRGTAKVKVKTATPKPVVVRKTPAKPAVQKKEINATPQTPAVKTTATKPAATRPAGDPGTVKIRVATYNTQFGKSPQQIIENLQSVHPDLVFLQETSRSNLRRYARALNMNYQFGPYDPKAQFGIGILAPGEIQPVKIFTMPNERNFGLAAIIKIANKDVLVVSTHLKSLPRPLVSGVLKAMGPHKEQANRILELVDKTNLPTIVAGDFNTMSFTPEYLTMATAMKDCAVAVGNTTQPSIFVEGTGYRIDYVFVRGPWKPLTCQVSPLPGSDHRLVWTDLNLMIGK